MVRGLDLQLLDASIQTLCSFEGAVSLDKMSRDKTYNFPGGKGGGEPPVPIPNTVVKPSSGHGTATSRGGRVTRCQD